MNLETVLLSSSTVQYSTVQDNAYRKRLYLCHLNHFLGNLDVTLVVLTDLSDDEAGVGAPDHPAGTQFKL